MNTRVWKRFGRKLAQTTFEFALGVFVMAFLIGIFAVMVMAGAWVTSALFGITTASKWLVGGAMAIAAICIVGEVSSLYVKTQKEIAEEDIEIMNILKGDRK